MIHVNILSSKTPVQYAKCEEEHLIIHLNVKPTCSSCYLERITGFSTTSTNNRYLIGLSWVELGEGV